MYPRIRFHFFSSGTDAVNERLERGLLDFAVIVQHVDLSKYNYLRLPSDDSWGLLMRKDSDLCFRPLSPALSTSMYVIWRKYQLFSPIAALLLEELNEMYAE